MGHEPEQVGICCHVDQIALPCVCSELPLNFARCCSVFGSLWLSYTQSLRTVLSGWDEGDFASCRPALPLPFAGLLSTNK